MENVNKMDFLLTIFQMIISLIGGGIIVALPIVSTAMIRKFLISRDIKEGKYTERVYGLFPLKIMEREKYIKTDFNTLCAMYNSGIKLKWDSYYETYCFDKDHKDEIYCLVTLQDKEKFQKYVEENKIQNNESKDGYEYILKKISEYKNHQEELSNQAFENLVSISESFRLNNSPSLNYTPPASTKRNGFIDACYKKDNY